MTLAELRLVKRAIALAESRARADERDYPVSFTRADDALRVILQDFEDSACKGHSWDFPLSTSKVADCINCGVRRYAPQEGGV